MKVLLDNNVDHRIVALLTGHEVHHVQKLGWDRLRNGELIAAAEESSFVALVTADKNMEYQQSLRGRSISILILSSRLVDFGGIAPLVPEVLRALETLTPGSFVRIGSN